MRLTAAVATSALLAGCAGPQWPTKVTTISAAAAAHAPHGRVDILPLDLELWTEPGYDANVDQLRGTAEAKILNAAVEGLTQHAYEVDALIDWNGDYSAGHALERDAVVGTIGALARYGETPGVRAGELPRLALPARLGTTTGADATLYIGGWGYVANHHESTADKVAEGVAIALVVVAVVVLIAGAASALHDGKSRGEDRVVHHSRSRGTAVAHAAASIATETALDALETVGEGALTLATHPEWADDPALPHEGDSQMYLEMTLVDNHTGLALWHAHQQFPANAASPDDVSRVAKTLLATLPAT